MEYITTMKMNELDLKCVNTGHLKKKKCIIEWKKARCFSKHKE